MKNPCVVKAAVMLGLVGAAAKIAKGQAPAPVNITGATLFQSFFTAPQSTFDAIDANNDGNARLSPPYNGVVQQLAPTGVNPTSGWWALQYRAVGSGNGLQELVNYSTRFATLFADVASSAPNLENAWVNRVKWYDNATGNQGAFNANNPGGAPFRSNTTTLLADTTNGGVRFDAAIMDVPTKWFVRVNGPASPIATPTGAGYGQNLKNAIALDGTPASPVQANRLRTLTSTDNVVTLNFNTAAPDTNTVFDTPIAAAPIAFMVNYGTGHQQMTYTQLRHLFVTGRLPTGENLTAITRDIGSGTRNGAMNSIGIDPSFGVGENVGTKNDDVASSPTDRSVVGANYVPSNKGGSGSLERAVLNTRLGVGTSGAERGITQSWLLNHRVELLGVQNDLGGGTAFARPTIDSLLDNDLNGYNIEGPETFATVGDPKANGAANGGTGWIGAFDPYRDTNSNGQYDLGEPFTDLNSNGLRDAQNAEQGLTNYNPSMRNHFGAQYINNISRSIDAFVNFSGLAADFTPGQFLANNFILVAATDFVPNPVDPKNLIVNSNLNQALQDTVRTANTIYTNGVYNAFNNSFNGVVPTRAALTAGTYTDGSTSLYRQLNGSTVTGGTATIPARNRIAADFDGNGVRNANDICQMVSAWRHYNGGLAWNAPDGIYGAGAGQTVALDLLGDVNNDGNFNAADVRYFVDGLALSTASGTLDRKLAFTQLDTCFGGNFFATTVATGGYTAGASRGDVAGAVGTTPGYAPVGSNGAVNAADIDYVYRQFKQNAAVTDGAANWSNLSEASNTDLSADMTGDLTIDQADITELVTVILHTTMGDVNLNGTCDAADLAIANANLNQTGGWAMGDVDGSGTITAADIAVINACMGPVCGTADFNGDSDVGTDADIEAFFSCLAGSCCPTCFIGGADFNGDGDIGTDASTLR